MNSFAHTLGYALMADYFNVSFLTTNGRGKDLDMLCSKHVFFHFQELLVSQGNEIKVFEYTNDNNFVWIEFNNSAAKEVVSDYFENFNLANRISKMIIMPDVYEGEDHPKQYICNWYLNSIEEFFKNNFENSNICIPTGISEDEPNERTFMVYNKEGMQGLYKGSQVFDKSPIRLINFKD
jgi:hypothetical protein